MRRSHRHHEIDPTHGFELLGRRLDRATAESGEWLFLIVLVTLAFVGVILLYGAIPRGTGPGKNPATDSTTAAERLILRDH